MSSGITDTPLESAVGEYDEPELLVSLVQAIERGDYDNVVVILVEMHSAAMLCNLSLGKHPAIPLTKEEFTYVHDMLGELLDCPALQRLNSRECLYALERRAVALEIMTPEDVECARVSVREEKELRGKPIEVEAMRFREIFGPCIKWRRVAHETMLRRFRARSVEDAKLTE
ncbi:hypothetical protein KIPB_005013 [Kipferlia bialata]|uniref:Uncharacterized protein n=1 Tax=Kipferlia bialata TaxID=797122 RepID=A0A9K3CXT6_9EUKA|nr:hypothetical protein KIPB_005013 [Kipferlia bialata]|eukprot:g5013.t1